MISAFRRIEEDPEFDTKKAKKKLHRYVENHDHAIRFILDVLKSYTPVSSYYKLVKKRSSLACFIV